MNQDDETNQEIRDDDSEDTAESTISSDMEKDDCYHRQEVLHLRHACRNELLRTTMV